MDDLEMNLLNPDPTDGTDDLLNLQDNNDDIEMNILFSHLENEDDNIFLEYFAKMNAHDKEKVLNGNNGIHTLLQYACGKGLTRVVKILLENGADSYLKGTENGISPAALACIGGYHKILNIFASNETLSSKSTSGESLLQIVIKKGRKTIINEDIDYDKCRRILLSNKQCKADINYTDAKGNSALHYATKSGNQEAVMDLLRNGSRIGIWNKCKEPPLIDMSASTFTSFLDECLTTNNERLFDDDYEIKFKYDFLIPLNINMNRDINVIESKTEDLVSTPETDILLYMSKHPELKSLLSHPVMTSFVYMKWRRISGLFYANTMFYTIFWFSLILYIIMTFQNAKHITNTTQIVVKISTFLIISGTALLVLRELCQALITPKAYFKKIQNWMELALIVITMNIIISEHPNQQLYAVAILLSSAEFILLVGCFSRFAMYIEMLKTVSKNFLKFLLWYCILIIAFALSFYTLFRTMDANDTKPIDDDYIDFFRSPQMSLLKTIIMLIGELDAGSTNFDQFPITSHIIFTMFVFVIPMVLLNLLNGLAVNDTQAIMSNAQLVSYISRVELISYFERIFVKNSKSENKNAFHYLMSYSNLGHIFLKPIAMRISIFPHFLPTASMNVKVNQSSMDINSEKLKSSWQQTIYNDEMDLDIINAAQNIISERRKKIESECDKIKELENKIDRILQLLGDGL